MCALLNINRKDAENAKNQAEKRAASSLNTCDFSLRTLRLCGETAKIVEDMGSGGRANNGYNTGAQ
jgi:hypothetical protein